jgi:SAM-dependent methyltransferase
VHAVQADAHQLPFPDGLFDIVFHQGFLEHFETPQPLLAEQSRVLKPNGLILVDVPQRFNWYALEKRLRMICGKWNCGWESDFTYPRLRTLLKRAGFEEVTAYGRKSYPPPVRMLRHLERIETRLDRQLLPASLWEAYDRLWTAFEDSRLALYTLQCIGIVARKTG